MSILNQSFRDFEFIVMADDPSDKTSATLEHYKLADARMSIYHQDGHGLAAALNEGCRLARGKYVARMDADDVSFPNRLEKQVNLLEGNPRVAVVGGAIDVINSEGIHIDRFSYPASNEQIQRALLHSNCIAHPTVVMRKDVHHAIGGYRKMFLHAEDYDLWLRIAEHFELANLVDPVLEYRIHPHQVYFRDPEQQALSTLAAQLVARKRRETGLDPIDEVGRITPEVVRKLGSSDGEIRVQVGRAYLSRAQVMLQAGYNQAAQWLLNTALASWRSSDVGKDLLATAWLTLASAHHKRGQLLLAAVAATRALLADPGQLANLQLSRSSSWIAILIRSVRGHWRT